MQAEFSALGQLQIAQAEIDETKIVGGGGVVSPHLSIPVRLDVSNVGLRPHDGLEIVSLRGRLSSVAGIITASPEVQIGFLMPHDYDGFKQQLQYLNFPLNGIQIAALENLRKGGNLTLHLEGTLIVRKLRALNDRPPNQPLADIVWGHVRTYDLRLNSDVTILRDTWISNVLPQVGYSVTHVMEIPVVPLKACERFDHAFKALQQAQDRHRIGQYDDAVGKCRVALDQFFEHEEKVGDDGITRRVPILAKGWEKKIGEATYQWLNAVFGAIKAAGNPAHHSPNEHFDQFQSQMVIYITAAVVAYAARTTDVANTANLK